MRQILIDYSQKLIRSALVEDNEVVEVIVDEPQHSSIVGNVYVGIVKNILPSQFAFVDIGQEYNAFLHLSDNKESDLYTGRRLNIKNGQRLLVQVIKDATGTKGAAVTTQISFSSRNLVIFKTNKREIGISKKIEDMKDRVDLKKIADNLIPKDFGLIMRTESIHKTEEELREELDKLLVIGREVIEKSKEVNEITTIYKDDYILYKALKELNVEDADRILINDRHEIQNLRKVMQKNELSNKIDLYTGETPMFTYYMIESQIEKIFNKKVWLKSGGFLIIEQTEACVVIDVNTGKFSGNRNHVQSVLKINLEAAIEISKQLRLRNLSGMIIIDFIDMKDKDGVMKLYELLSQEIKKDRVPTRIIGMTKLGLMQVTRKKSREPLSKILEYECPRCKGLGRIRK